ncbi:2,3,4,5-tetrahydropyridine-2,6-dicarboxylate N-succinyltransferase, partial [Glaciimonas sp. CA11.2]|nr:2,3,4,5-tetrahydropyridine-2,6-dicarboxylate N-succinyltransferase [Glaciimonas sp. CA11.2]
MTQSLEQFIDQAWEQRTEFSPKTAPSDLRAAVAKVIAELNQGTLRVAEKIDGNWIVN